VLNLLSAALFLAVNSVDTYANEKEKEALTFEIERAIRAAKNVQRT